MAMPSKCLTNRLRRTAAAIGAALVITAVLALDPAESLGTDPLAGAYLQGVNLATAGFGSERIGKTGSPGRFGFDYTYPVQRFTPGYTSPAYFVAAGMNAFRLSVLWERLQPALGAPLNEAELARLIAATHDLTQLGAWVIVDVHNYARYRGDIIGSSGVPVSALADLWEKLAPHFAGEDHVILDLMNEPHDISTATWVEAANAAIAAIRTAGAHNIILVGGNSWSGAHRWYDRVDGESNAEAMLKIVDPLDRTVFEAHLYLDSNSSGTSADCVSDTIGVERLEPFTRWLKENHKLGFIGEFGAGSSNECLAALTSMVRFMNEHSNILIGWTYWGAGPWWPKDYFTLLEPEGGKDVPQMQALKPFLEKPPIVGDRAR